MMELELAELKEKFDKAYVAGTVSRDKGAANLVFYFISHWAEPISIFHISL